MSLKRCHHKKIKTVYFFRNMAENKYLGQILKYTVTASHLKRS